MNAKDRRKAKRDLARRTPNVRLIPMDFGSGGLVPAGSRMFIHSDRGPVSSSFAYLPKQMGKWITSEKLKEVLRKLPPIAGVIDVSKG